MIPFLILSIKADDLNSDFIFILWLNTLFSYFFLKVFKIILQTLFHSISTKLLPVPNSSLLSFFLPSFFCLLVNFVPKSLTVFKLSSIIELLKVQDWCLQYYFYQFHSVFFSRFFQLFFFQEKSYLPFCSPPFDAWSCSCQQWPTIFLHDSHLHIISLRFLPKLLSLALLIPLHQSSCLCCFPSCQS